MRFIPLQADVFSLVNRIARTMLMKNTHTHTHTHKGRDGHGTSLSAWRTGKFDSDHHSDPTLSP